MLDELVFETLFYGLRDRLNITTSSEIVTADESGIEQWFAWRKASEWIAARVNDLLEFHADRLKEGNDGR